MKKTYEAPKMEKLGSFEALTMSTNSGSVVDAAFNGVSIVNSLS